MARSWAGRGGSFVVMLGALLLFGAPASSHAATSEGAVITNGTVQLGVNAEGSLNYDCAGAGDTGCPAATVSGETVVGLRLVASNLEATADGCKCEGWGVADAGSGLSGSANEADGNFNVTVDNFTSPSPDRAISKVTITDPAIPGFQLQVTQDYHPSALSPNLYSDTVTILNTGANAVTDLRYRRAMDWDIEPTEFDEWVTIQGTSPQLLFDSDDGFASNDPLAGPSYIDSEAVCGAAYTGPCEFTDLGSGGEYPTATSPDDHGGLFDFGFGALAPGESRTFTVDYGASENETSALAALSDGGAQVFSLGESNCGGTTVATCGDAGNAGVEQGEPATFMFGFVTSKADLALTKSDSPDPVKVGEELTYSIDVTNAGPQDAAGVLVTDSLPAGVDFVSASSSQGTCSGTSTVSCNLGKLPNGAAATVTIVVRPTAEGVLTNTAEVSSPGDDPNLSNNSASAETLALIKFPKCGGKEATIIALPGQTSVGGTSGNDVIVGNKTAQEIRGGKGNDRICGRGGDDRIKGVSGNDYLAGGKDDDRIRAGAGNDSVHGLTGDDTLNGEAGNDFIAGGGGDDRIHGSAGNDELHGRAGDDSMKGGADDDLLRGGKGFDKMFGGPGDDFLRGGGGPDRCDGGSGSNKKIGC